MGPFRVLQISIVVLMLFGSTWLVRAVGMVASPDGTSSTWLGSQDALAGVLNQGDNGDNGGDNGGDDGDNNGNNNNNSNSNSNSNNNGNSNSNNNGNDNNNDDNDNGGDGNDNTRVRHVVVRQPNESVNRPTKCFDAREVGVVQLGTGSYDVTVQVMPHSSFGQTTRLTLRRLDPGSVAAVSGGTLVDSVVFQLDAQSSCDGAAIGTLPNNVNMGITYNVTNPVDKAKLQIVHLEGGAWVNVPTVPDPVAGNPYVSATINMAGTYALILKP
jgi:hypothetical protein